MYERPWLIRVARRVILDIRDCRSDRSGKLDQRVLVLDELGTHSPQTLATLVGLVASFVPDEVVASIAADSDDLAPVDELIFREAHARYANDERDEWVRWGESGYQRLAYLRRRERGA